MRGLPMLKDSQDHEMLVQNQVIGAVQRICEHKRDRIAVPSTATQDPDLLRQVAHNRDNAAT